jgi:hypothetical protein
MSPALTQCIVPLFAFHLGCFGGFLAKVLARIIAIAKEMASEHPDSRLGRISTNACDACSQRKVILKTVLALRVQFL